MRIQTNVGNRTLAALRDVLAVCTGARRAKTASPPAPEGRMALNPRRRLSRAIALASAAASVVSLFTVGIVLAAPAGAAAPIVIDDFAGNTVGPRTVTPLPLPDTSTTPPGQFSQANGVATMTMTGNGNGQGGIQLDYDLPHLDLTSQGNNTQFFLVFPSINRTDTTTTDPTAADISISLTGGGVTGTYSTGVGNVTGFNIVLNFSCVDNTVCFSPQPDFTDVTHVTVMITYPRNDDPNGTLTAVLDSINTTPTGGSVPPPAFPNITSPGDPFYGSSGTTLDFPVEFTSNGQPAKVYSAKTAGPLTKDDISVSGTAPGVSSFDITDSGNGADYTIQVGPLTGDGTVVVSIPTGAAVDTWAQPTVASEVVSVHFALAVPPEFTGSPPPAATVGTPYSYEFTAGGTPAATYALTSGTLPDGLMLDGAGNLSGTPAAGTGGTYPITVTATNTAGTDTDKVTLTVFEGARITSADHAQFLVGSPGSFTITTSGFAAPELTFAATPLPDGLTLTDNRDGTATIAGTPAPDAAGSTQIGVTATNQTNSDTQQLTIDVDLTPAITSPDTATFVVGDAGSFTVTTSGSPAPAVTETGALPDGLSFVDNGDGTATISGTPTVSDAGASQITLSADNRSGSATQPLSIRVDARPAITSADTATFVAGTAGNFTVTTTGLPVPALSETGALPDGLSFVDNGDGTAALSGTPTSADAGTSEVTLQAVNEAGSVTQRLTLLINSTPTITSPTTATFTTGTAGSFTVTTTGLPAPVLSETGALPAGLSFVDDGDGTATVAGAPAAGSAGTFPLTLTAANSVGHTDQTFTLNVVRKSQTITVTSIPPSPAVVGGSYSLAATSDSGLDVVYSIDPATTNSACSLTGSTVSFDAAGSCVVDFDQPGDGTFAPAAQVQQTIAVTKVATAVSVTTAPASSVYGQDVHATATVTADRGTPSGTVQFSVDGTDVGTPVVVTGGTAVSPALTAPGGTPLAPGAHPVTALFVPDDGVTYPSATGSVTQVVDRAATKTTLTVHAHHLRAVVAAVAPGAGTPSGTVRFSVGGHAVGTATLAGGVAALTYTVPTGKAHMVAAAYSGDPDFTASSASTTRRDPKITARLSSSRPRSRFGWYRTPVTVRFTCTTAGAPLTAPCPAPVVLRHQGAARSVTRTISATDGGAATVAVRGINIDLTRPTVSIKGARGGATYQGSAPRVRCAATDRLSGAASCRLTKAVHGTHVTYRATATDRAGNTANRSQSITVLPNYLAGTRYHNGAFTVHVGHVYTFVVNGTARRPVYYDAAVYPNKPTRKDNAFLAAGHHRWTLGLYMQRGLLSHRYWNIGVRIGRKLHVIKIRIG